MSSALLRFVTPLLLLWLVQFWIFSDSFQKYFNHDSLFYLIYSPHSFREFFDLLLEPDPARQYRPLTHGFMALVVPVFGLDPRPYHWIPLVLHCLNTALFYSLSKRLLVGNGSTLAAAGFWSLHSVAGWITYDVTYLSDLLLASFLLSSLVLALDGYERQSRIRSGMAVVLYVAALLTKEAALTFPLALFICLVLSRNRRATDNATAGTLRRFFKESFRLTTPYWVLALTHASLMFYWLHAGLLYEQRTDAAYAIDPLANLASKAKYFYWALNLPETASLDFANKRDVLPLLLLAALLLVWLVEIALRRWRLSPIEWGGLLWLVGMNVPALMLSSRLAKWYLYVPLIGLSLAFGHFAGNLRNRLAGGSGWIGSLATAGLLIPVVAMSVVETRNFLKFSESSYASDVVETCLRDFQELHPTLPPKVTLFVLPSFETDVSDFFGRGKLYQLYYPGSRVEMLFADKGDEPPPHYRGQSDVWILYYLNGHVYDVTKHYLEKGQLTLFLLPTFERVVPEVLKSPPSAGEAIYRKHVQMLFADEGAVLPEDYHARSDVWILRYMNGHFYDSTRYFKGRFRASSEQRLVNSLENVRVAINRKEVYPSYERFDTPGNSPVFFPSPVGDILTQIAGCTVTIPVGPIKAGSSLRFDVSWMFDEGDGAWGEARLRVEGKEFVLFSQYFLPEPGRRSRRWREVSVDLRPFANKSAELILKCYNEPGHSTAADWLNWRGLAIEHPSDRQSKEVSSGITPSVIQHAHNRSGNSLAGLSRAR